MRLIDADELLDNLMIGWHYALSISDKELQIAIVTLMRQIEAMAAEAVCTRKEDDSNND